MILYHGGLEVVSKPRIIRGDRIGDFGIGFYTTTDLEEAALSLLTFTASMEVLCQAK